MRRSKLSKACNMLHQSELKMNWLFKRSASSLSPMSSTKHSPKCLAINPTSLHITGFSISTSASVLSSQSFFCPLQVYTTSLVKRFSNCVWEFFVQNLYAFFLTQYFSNSMPLFLRKIIFFPFGGKIRFSPMYSFFKLCLQPPYEINWEYKMLEIV